MRIELNSSDSVYIAFSVAYLLPINEPVYPNVAELPREVVSVHTAFLAV